MLEGLAKVITRPARRTTAAMLSRRERRILRAVARAAIPAGKVVPEPGASTIDGFQRQFRGFRPPARAALRATLWAVELGAVTRHLRPFTRLDQETRVAYLLGWHRGNPAQRLALRALLTPLKMAHFDDPRIFEAMNCVYAIDPPKRAESARWRQNMVSLAELDGDESLECDVVVVGTGAGGAAAAKELAERGYAVAMIEEGGYFDRRDFDGRGLKAMHRMYRGGGAVFTVGRPSILIPHGKTVGGSTTINSGTCFRVPSRVLERWRREFGLKAFTPETMAPYFARVESILGVEDAKWPYIGGCGRVIKRGCDALGYTGHGPLKRNAPDCDGQGLCCFGCPTDAKRSANLTYVPLALQHYAMLFSRARVTRILLEDGRAVGVEAHSVSPSRGHDDGRRNKLTVRAKAVIISCGTYYTPALLHRSGLANSSGQLGKNLSIHPATAIVAEFDEEILGWKAIPQGYSIDEFAEDGLMFEGGFTPLDLSAAAHGFFGREFTRVMERFNHLACFGFMVQDTSRGRVRVTGDGKPIVFYSLNRQDVAQIKRGIEILTEIYFAAGARNVYPPVHGHDQMRSLRDLHRFRRSKLRALDLSLSAYHPLGTARMGTNPRRSVVGPNHECHDVPGLYIVDGSSVPSSLGVNPQVTIMAMATRAAELMSRRLETLVTTAAA